jgi:hypothetical protein
MMVRLAFWILARWGSGKPGTLDWARKVIDTEPRESLPALIRTCHEMSHRYSRPEQRSQCTAKLWAACERLEEEYHG